eukprot:c17400_g1_i1.p1 GENE.c17400_g1_i1~~c17400_g1_i1.p1  ORF type:complete len:495 (+),score=45.17 c17400_g1_i1:23-1486(+)
MFLFRSQNVIESLFQSAAQGNAPHISKLLLESGVDVNITNQEGKSLFIVALERGAFPVCAVLVRHGVDINQPTATGETPIELAVRSNQPQMVEWLLLHGAWVKSPLGAWSEALHSAIVNGNISITTMIIQAGANLDAADMTGVSSVLKAVTCNREEILSVLLDAGASPNMATLTGWTALHEACSCGYVRMVITLVKRGAIPGCPDKFGRRPMDVATKEVIDGLRAMQDKSVFGILLTSFTQPAQQALTPRPYMSNLSYHSAPVAAVPPVVHWPASQIAPSPQLVAVPSQLIPTSQLAPSPQLGPVPQPTLSNRSQFALDASQPSFREPIAATAPQQVYASTGNASQASSKLSDSEKQQLMTQVHTLKRELINLLHQQEHPQQPQPQPTMTQAQFGSRASTARGQTSSEIVSAASTYLAAGIQPTKSGYSSRAGINVAEVPQSVSMPVKSSAKASRQDDPLGKLLGSVNPDPNARAIQTTMHYGSALK